MWPRATPIALPLDVKENRGRLLTIDLVLAVHPTVTIVATRQALRRLEWKTDNLSPLLEARTALPALARHLGAIRSPGRALNS